MQDEVCAPVLRSVTNQIPEICQVFETLENCGRTWYVDYMMISFTFSTESWKECSMRLNAGKVPLKSLSEMSNVRRMVFSELHRYNETHCIGQCFTLLRARFIQDPRNLIFLWEVYFQKPNLYHHMIAVAAIALKTLTGNWQELLFCNTIFNSVCWILLIDKRGSEWNNFVL